MNLIKSSVGDDYQGMFGLMSGIIDTNYGVIKNVGMVDVNIKGNLYIGGRM